MWEMQYFLCSAFSGSTGKISVYCIYMVGSPRLVLSLFLHVLFMSLFIVVFVAPLNNQNRNGNIAGLLSELLFYKKNLHVIKAVTCWYLTIQVILHDIVFYKNNEIFTEENLICWDFYIVNNGIL